MATSSAAKLRPAVEPTRLQGIRLFTENTAFAAGHAATGSILVMDPSSPRKAAQELANTRLNWAILCFRHGELTCSIEGGGIPGRGT